MSIKYSQFKASESELGFVLDSGTNGNTTFELSKVQPAGIYYISSKNADSTIEFYAIAEDGTLAGYTSSLSITTTKAFNKIVAYGITSNDLITFSVLSTGISPTSSGQENSGAAPYITSVSDADLANIDDTTIITGGNFATNVTVTFTGADQVVRNAKSVVRTNSTQLIVTRPDAFLEDNSPYTMTVQNPGIPQSAYKTFSSSITAGGDPIWVTPSTLTEGKINTPYSIFIEATDPDGSSISYSLSSGNLPGGLSLNQSTGEISGTPTAGGENTFIISASDTSGNMTNRSFNLLIAVPINATGGIISTISGYKIHSFTSSGTFTVNAGGGTIEYLMVAGGGGGAHNNIDSRQSSGGGAGGLLQGNDVTISVGSYPIVIGAGGAATIDGNNTTAFNLTALKGGRGGQGGGASGGGGVGVYGSGGGQGGSGGGGTIDNAPGTPGQGNNGGYATFGASLDAAGGGGGAGGPGGNASGATAGSGGIGIISNITGTNVGYAGGGGNNGDLGYGGGFNGSDSNRTGKANTGGGGKGTTGPGGSGIVIIRYPI